ncbi:MAG: hypothetical protein E6Q56_01045 [Mycobacterium sp.]|nr:MAG: hypothetical protein E6Q56_01045 [Mycobacterium sp.]
MTALSAVVFALSWWMGLYLAVRDPRKPALVLAAVGLCGFATVVALDAIRMAGEVSAESLGRVEIYLVVLPGVAWFAVLMELARPHDAGGGRGRDVSLTAVVAAAAALGANWAGSVDGPLRGGHWLVFAVISGSTLAAMILAVRRVGQPARVAGVLAVATLFFALGNAIIVIPLGLVPSWIALAATGFDILLLGFAVALWDAFDEGQALRSAMLRSFLGTAAVVVVFGGQLLLGVAVVGEDGRGILTVLLFTVVAVAIGITVLADPLAGLLDRVAFARFPALRAERATLRNAETALPSRSPNPLDGLDDETFVRLTRRALSHYGDLAKLVASPLTDLPEIDARLAARAAPDQPLERANELRALLAEHIDRLKPRNDGDFGTTEQWRYYNALYFPYVAGVRAYAQNATAAGLDPVARQAWQWMVTEVPQRSLHNWQNAAARLIAAELRDPAAIGSSWQ